MKKFTSIVAVLLLLTMVVGCGANKTKSSANVDFEVTTDGSYPIETDETITYWVQLHESAAANYTDLNDTTFGKELIAQTGINVDFIHPPVTQVTEKFNLMIASRELPDIIEWGWYGYPGGPHTAISEEIIIPLNTVFEKAAPNLTKIFDENPDYAKDASTDEGEFYCFPMIRENDYLNTYYGPMFRKDLLDKAGMSVPETLDEWEKVLYKFKEMGVEVPLATIFSNGAMNNSEFLGAFGVSGTFYVEDGKVKFGPYEEEPYSEFVKLMAKWYKDGIIDPDCVDTSQGRRTALGLSGKWGAVFGSCGGSFGAWIPAIQKENPSAEFVPAKYPVMNKGDYPKFGQKNFNMALASGCAAISTQCKNVELAARLLDFGYSDAGFMLYNFGKEGESYTIVDGIPTYDKSITDGERPMSQMMANYARASYFGPMVQAENYMRQYAKLDVQKQGIDVWSQNNNTDYVLPYVTRTAEENSEYSRIMADIDTYREESLYNFITGVVSTDELPKYFENLKSMGIERAIEINEAAYARYLER